MPGEMSRPTPITRSGTNGGDSVQLAKAIAGAGAVLIVLLGCAAIFMRSSNRPATIRTSRKHKVTV
jgi:hypothetical protein